MKLNKLFMGFLGALALTACSSEDVVTPDNGGTTGDGEPRYMSVTIRNANPGTRAGGDQTNGEIENSLYEEGFLDENKVNSLRFYFFDENGNAAKIAFNGNSYYDCPAEDIDNDNVTSDMPNVEKILSAVIVIDGTKTDEGDRNILKQMVALVNFKDADGNSYDTSLDADLSLSELEGKINSEAVAKANGFLMTSSSFYADKYGIATEIKPSDIKAKKELAMANPVDIYVERVLAKVRVTAPWDDVEESDKLSVTWNGKSYTAVALYDKNGIAIRNGNTPDAKQIYVIIDNWQLWWTADKSYLFKKVGNWDQALAWQWNHSNYHRSYWAENPATVTLAKHSHAYAEIPVGYKEDEYAKYTAYCLENAADPDNGGLKKWYDPDNETSNRTLVYLSANLVTIDESKNATSVDLAEWAGYKYTKENVKIAMFAPNEKKYYFLHTEETTNEPVVDKDGNLIESGNSSYRFIELTDKDVELVTGLASGNATDEKENSKRYLSYLQLVPEKRGDKELLWADKIGTDGKTYSVEKQLYVKKVNTAGETVYAKVDVDYVNSQLQSVGGAKVWEGGKAYYYHELQHLGKTGVDNEGKAFNYGVVRNHIYEVELNNVVGIGTPVLSYVDEEGNTQWEDITPQKPEPDAYFLAARINILSWRVVNNSASLEW